MNNQRHHQHSHSMRLVDSGDGRDETNYCRKEEYEKPEPSGEYKTHGCKSS